MDGSVAGTSWHWIAKSGAPWISVHDALLVDLTLLKVAIHI